MKKAITRFLACVLCLGLVGCASQITRQGHIHQELNHEQIKVGLTYDDLVRLMGYPSFAHPTQPRTVFYFSALLSQKHFTHPQIVHQHVLVVRCDAQGVVESIKTLNMKNYQDVSIDSETTLSTEKETLTFLDAISRNVGQMDKKKK